MRFNGDSGANYNYISASFSTTYNSTTEAGANYMGTGPGFNHGESVLYTIYIAQFPTMVHVRSHSNTNGSGEGDAHIFTGNYTGGSSITSIELAGNYPGVLTANAAHDAGNRWSLSVIR